MKITIAGAGYVGLVTGLALSHLGREITILDVDEAKISALQKGKAPIYEKDLDGLLEECGSRMTFTTDPATAYRRRLCAVFTLHTIGATPYHFTGGACDLTIIPTALRAN